jgi:hypothetical protein
MEVLEGFLEGFRGFLEFRVFGFLGFELGLGLRVEVVGGL